MNYRQAAAAYGIPVRGDATLATTDAAKDLIAARTNYSIFVQRLVYVPSTVAAQAITVKDDTGTPVLLALIPASQATPYTIEFGPEGKQIAEGKKLQATCTAGPGGVFFVEGYYKLTAVQGMHASNQ